MAVKDPREKRECRAIAFAHYLELGPDRTLAKVLKYLRDSGFKLSSGALANWSSRDGWVAKAKDHDAGVSETARKAMAAQQAVELISGVTRVQTTGQKVLDRVEELLASIDPGKIDVDDLAKLTDVALSCYRLSEVMSGGVSDRVEGVATGGEEIIRKLEESLTRISAGGAKTIDGKAEREPSRPQLVIPIPQALAS